MLIFAMMISWKNILLCALAVFGICACKGNLDPEGPQKNPAVSREGTEGLGYKKVMILYSEGYNNLTTDLDNNIDQLCEGAIPSRNDRYAIVVYSHAAAGKIDYTTPTEPVLFRIYRNFSSVVRDTLKTYGSGADTMTPEFMRGVLNDIRIKFPSASYGMVYSSHGDGWIPASYEGETTSLAVAPSWVGAQYDGSYRNARMMDIDVFRSAIPFHLEYIAFDACLMGGVEVAYELKDACDYIVASPTEVITDGFNYPGMAGRLLCEGDSDLQGLCEDYYNMCVEDSYATIGLYDCSQMQGLADACKPVYEAHRDKLFTFDSWSVQSYNYSFDYNYDFRDIIVKLGASENELKSIDDALSKVIIYKNSTPYFITTKIDPERFSGIGAYLPEADSPQLNELYRKTAWNKATGLLK